MITIDTVPEWVGLIFIFVVSVVTAFVVGYLLCRDIEEGKQLHRKLKGEK